LDRLREQRMIKEMALPELFATQAQGRSDSIQMSSQYKDSFMGLGCRFWDGRLKERILVFLCYDILKQNGYEDCRRESRNGVKV
jgi:hypothetical protein